MQNGIHEEDQIQRRSFIVFIKQAKASTPINEIYSKGGFSNTALSNWRAKFDSLDGI